MQLVNGAQFLSITLLLVLFIGSVAAAVFQTVIVAFNIVVFNMYVCITIRT